MEYPKDTYKRGEDEIIGWWIRTGSLEGLSPVTQMYGICFNSKGEILICRQDKDGKWQIPGGHPEAGETIEETLMREMEEEVDVKVKDIRVLGVVKVNYPNNPDNFEGEEFYQSRLICDLEKLLPQTPDPDNGKVWERMFVPAEEVTKYIKWGAIGEAMFKDAIELWGKSHS